MIIIVRFWFDFVGFLTAKRASSHTKDFFESDISKRINVFTHSMRNNSSTICLSMTMLRLSEDNDASINAERKQHRTLLCAKIQIDYGICKKNKWNFMRIA